LAQFGRRLDSLVVGLSFLMGLPDCARVGPASAPQGGQHIRLVQQLCRLARVEYRYYYLVDVGGKQMFAPVRFCQAPSYPCMCF